MGLLQPIKTRPSHLRAALMGFGKSGKTYTAYELAIGVHRFFGLDTPVAVFDTEQASAYLEQRFSDAGVDVLATNSRSFDDLMETIDECTQSGIEVLVIDSLSHVWEELMRSYQREVNRQRESAGWEPRDDLGPRDWAILRERWAMFVEAYTSAPIHMIACLRAGHDWGHEVDERGHRELVKTGVKIKGEGGFGYEASLLIEMTREATRAAGQTLPVVQRRAVVLGDRFGALDGASTLDPTFEFFRPHVKLLDPEGFDFKGASNESRWAIDETGRGAFCHHKRRVERLWEEIEGECLRHYPGQSTEDKAGRRELLYLAFGTYSATAVRYDTSVTELQKGLATIKAFDRKLGDEAEFEARVILEEIEGELSKRFPSTGAKDKAGRRDLQEEVFGTCSSTALQRKSLDELRAGLRALREVAVAPPKGAE